MHSLLGYLNEPRTLMALYPLLVPCGLFVVFPSEFRGGTDLPGSPDESVRLTSESRPGEAPPADEATQTKARRPGMPGADRDE